MATPVLDDLRRQFPQAEITAMCLSPISDLLKMDPAVDDIFCFTRRHDPKNIVEKLRAGHFDLGILLTNSFSSAWWFRLAHIPHRLGYRGHWRSLLLTDCIKKQKMSLHQVEFYKQILRPLGISTSPSVPRLYVSKQEELDAMEILYQKGYRANARLIGINPKAAFGAAKCWPLDRFRELTQRLLQDPNAFIVFFGDLLSVQDVQTICSGFPDRVINLSGHTNLRELVCLIKNCHVLVTNDSGPMHIAAALRTPVVALFGSTDDSATGPWNQKEAIINKHVCCSPCFRRSCPYDFQCMKQIGVEEVIRKTMERVQLHV